MKLFSFACGAVLAALTPLVATRGGSHELHFQTFARTGLRLTDILWTGRQFLYVDNTTNRVWAAGPSGGPLRLFARMPREVEETRCAVSLGGHGFPTGAIYCDSPTNTIYQVSPDGRKVTVFASLSHTPRSDGALTFDTVGRFGYNLVAATGRSGSPGAHGGTVFRIDARGTVRRVGVYTNPGGADEIGIAPGQFGSASGAALLSVDAGKTGSLVAVDAGGHARTLARFPDGLNPMAILTPGRGPRAGVVRPGLYVTDTMSHRVFFVAASTLEPYAGKVIVGSELQGRFWVVLPSRQRFVVQGLSTSLTKTHYNLEGATYIAN
jgi:hypothetical protein